MVLERLVTQQMMSVQVITWLATTAYASVTMVTKVPDQRVTIVFPTWPLGDLKNCATTMLHVTIPSIVPTINVAVDQVSSQTPPIIMTAFRVRWSLFSVFKLDFYCFLFNFFQRHQVTNAPTQPTASQFQTVIVQVESVHVTMVTKLFVTATTEEFKMLAFRVTNLKLDWMLLVQPPC